MAAILLGVLEEAPALVGRDVIWFVDNTSALFAAIKGCAGEASMDKMICIAHLIATAFNFRIYFEYIESDANWSDGASRNGGNDPFLFQEGFKVGQADLSTWTDLLQLPLKDVLSNVMSLVNYMRGRRARHRVLSNFPCE